MQLLFADQWQPIKAALSYINSFLESVQAILMKTFMMECIHCILNFPWPFYTRNCPFFLLLKTLKDYLFGYHFKIIKNTL